jgi:NADH pyrophosphatase NudC (nudix superfamily)
VRVITTALVERDGYLLLTQLAAGRFAGFWLLPSATAEEGTVEQTSLRMVWERTGYPVLEQQLVSVIEEPKPGVLALRFLFRSRVGERDAAVSDPEIAQTRWFSRAAVREVLAERDVVPNLGVMSVLRAWAEGATPRPLELLVEDTPCPCGTGFGYRGCCGWDAR